MDAETAQGLVRDLLGPVLIGTFWNCGFLAAELIALGFYLVRFPHDTYVFRDRVPHLLIFISQHLDSMFACCCRDQ